MEGAGAVCPLAAQPGAALLASDAPVLLHICPRPNLPLLSHSHVQMQNQE